MARGGWRAMLVATLVVAAGMVWAYGPGVSSELSRATEGQLQRIVATAPHLPSGDARFGVLLQTVFAPMPSPSARPAAVAHNRAATASEPAALALQARLQAGYLAEDFFPPAADWPEHLTVEQFRRAYGGVGTPRYRQTVRAIDTRLTHCAALASP